MCLVLVPPVATALLFVWPRSTAITRADAVVVLSGDHGERLPRALEIVRAGRAPTLVLAGSPDTPAAERLCHGAEVFEVVCLAPDPDSTRAEARGTGSLAAARGWRTVLVVTSTQHVTRTSLLFGRCYAGRLGVIGARPAYGAVTTIREIGHEWLGLAQAVLRRGC
jgi:uncharacterized SAM-binding protein YcdF (DUF218 family)